MSKNRSDQKRLNMGGDSLKLKINRPSVDGPSRSSSLVKNKVKQVVKQNIQNQVKQQKQPSLPSQMSNESKKMLQDFKPEGVNSRKKNRNLSGFLPNVMKTGGGRTEKRKTSFLQIKKYESNGRNSLEHGQGQNMSKESLVLTIIKQLTKHSFITQKGLNVYLIKSENITLLLSFMLDLHSLAVHKDRQEQYSELQYLFPLISQLDQYFRKDLPSFDPSKYDFNEELLKLKETIERRSQIQQDILPLLVNKQKLKSLEKQLERKEERMLKIEKIVQNLADKKDLLSKEMKEMLSGKQISEAIQKKMNNYNFKEQNRHSYQKRCKEYIETQTYMLQYATYLQNNKIAVAFDHDLTSFEHLSKIFEEKMKTILCILDKKEELDKNNLKIKYFIFDIVNFYKQKDKEMQKLCYQKTHCIQSFIRNVKMWVKNWEFKQDVLTNVKKLFVVSAVKMSAKMDIVKQIFKVLEKNEFEGTKGSFQELEILFKEIVEYFKMGNSFY